MLNYTIDELKETRFYREVSEEAKAKGRAEGRAEGQQLLLITLLNARLGSLSVTQQMQLQTLSSDRIQELSLALFNFKTMEDLDAWLRAKDL